MKYKKIVFVTTLFICAFQILKAQFANNLTQNTRADKQKLELTGEIPGVREGEKIILKKLVFDKGFEPVDTTQVVNGKFKFQYYIANAPQVFFIQFSEHSKFITLPLSNEKAFISSNISLEGTQEENLIDYILVDGSKTFNDWLYAGLGVYRTWVYTDQSISGSINKLKDSSLTNDRLEFIMGLLKAKQGLVNAVSIALDYDPPRDNIPLVYRNSTYDIQHSSVWPYIFNRLSSDAKNSFYGKWMSERMSLCVGQQSPNFNFAPKDGGETSLNEVLKKNKLTILHFWANGSLDRVRIHNELQKVYKKYKAKGLEVVSVSLDANPDKWKRVLQEDKIPGYQFCDFKEEEGPIAQLYKMDPNSTVNVLIDQNGKIVAWNVDGPALFGYLYQFFSE